MQAFTITGKTRDECVEQMYKRYGCYAKIWAEKEHPRRLFKKAYFEITGYWSEFAAMMPEGRPDSIGLSAPPFGQPPGSGKSSDALVAQDIVERSPASKENVALLGVKEEIKKLREEMASVSKIPVEHESVEKIRGLLKENEFPENYIENIVERIKKETPQALLDDFPKLQRQVVSWIGHSVRAVEPEKRESSPLFSTSIVVLVGPTGVGKTTTVGKLGAAFISGRFDEITRKVAFITIDMYRIAAAEQLAQVGSIMQVEVARATNREQLKSEIDRKRGNVDTIFVDTIGRSLGEEDKLEDMRVMLKSCGEDAETYLVIPANLTVKYLEKLLQDFDIFRYKAVLVTKLDDVRASGGIGSLIGTLSKRNVPIVYMTDSQEAHTGIHKACVTRLLVCLKGFEFDAEDIGKEFGPIS